jgi:hypothetical protein
MMEVCYKLYTTAYSSRVKGIVIRVEKQEWAATHF